MLIFSLTSVAHSTAETPPLGEESRSCVECHAALTPGIVEEWRESRHSRITPAMALGKPELERRFSGAAPNAKDTVVGCHECHGLNPERHGDNFEHFGRRINVVVSPEDCALCHPKEKTQYSKSKKAFARDNLAKNPLYMTLVNTVIGLKKEGVFHAPSDFTRQETCFACHGTEVVVKGLKSLKTVFGTIAIPELSNWPNQGVGRINPDGSRGACTACHPRHSFSIEVARKPFTCSQCHLEPDVPAWNVYGESKHANIFLSKQTEWDFNSVPWRLGRDFKAPTCAVCHNGLITSPEGALIAERSHDFGSRLWVRIFGLIYSHSQPGGGDTSVIKNRDGLPMPTTLAGEPAAQFLISGEERKKRQALMKAVCRGCHSTEWTEGHFRKFENTLKETDEMTRSATELVLESWRLGLADGANPFDETIEQKWIKQWLFYGNSVRYASAMTGAPDYAAFKYGWWGLTSNLEEMKHQMEVEKKLKK